MSSALPDLDVVVDLLQWIFAAQTSPDERNEIKRAIVSGWGDADKSEEVLVWHLLAYHSNLLELAPDEQLAQRPTLAANLQAVAERGSDGDAGRIWNLILDIFKGKRFGSVIGARPSVSASPPHATPTFGGWLGGLLYVALEAFRQNMEQQAAQLAARQPSTMDRLAAAWQQQAKAVEEVRHSDPLAAAQMQQQNLASVKSFVRDYMSIQRSLTISSIRV